MTEPDGGWDGDLAERQKRVRLALDRIQQLERTLDRIQQLERTAALVMLCWLAVSMLLLWAVS